MNNLFSILIFTSVLGLIAYYTLWYIQKKSRRTKDLTRIAGSHGFYFEDNINETPKNKFAPLRLFTLRVEGKMENVFKHNNPSIWIFDYEYCIPRDQDVGQTVAIIEMHQSKWPPIVIETRRKERFTVAAMRRLTQKIANLQLNYEEIDLPIHLEFSKHYRVFCKTDSKSLEGFLTAGFLDFMVQNSEWNIEVMNQWLLVYRQGQYLKPKDFKIFTGLVLDIYKLMDKAQPQA